jgi:hypothetical protein
MAPEKIMSRQKMKNVTNTMIARPPHSSQECKEARFYSKTTQKLCSREPL